MWNRFSKCLLSPSLLSQKGQALLLSCCCRADESDAQKFALAGARVNPAMSSETQFQDPSTLMAREHPSFFQYRSYWLPYAFLTTSLFLCVCFRCVFSFGESFLCCSDSLFPLELFHKLFPPLLQFSSLLLVFFSVVFCFFFHCRRNTISLEMYGNKTHCLIYKYSQSLSAFPRV